MIAKPREIDIRRAAVCATMTVAVSLVMHLLPTRAESSTPANGVPARSDSKSAMRTAGPTEARPLLWRIEAAKPSYLFGTIHVGRPEVTKLPEVVAAAHKASDALYTEIPMDPATLVEMNSKLFLANGQTLEGILPPDLVEDVRTELRSLHPSLELKPLDRLKVWALALTIAHLDEQLKNPGRPPLDMLLFQRAAAAGKEVGGLETVHEQLALFDSFSPGDQISMLRETLRMLRAMRAEGASYIDQLVAIYLSGDLEAIAAKMDEWMSLGDPKFNARCLEALLDERNARMAQRIAAKLESAPGKAYFFAIGAAHLYGPNGLLAKLETAGFRLTRIADP